MALLLATASTSGSAGQVTRYVAFGDSITEGINFDDCACACSLECGYPRRLQARLRNRGFNVVVENHGKGGERTPEGLTRLDMVLEGGGDVLLLMEGTNDISREISPETTIANLAEMARKAANRGLETVHATLIPRYPNARVDSENVLNELMARRIRELTYENGRQLVDPFAVFIRIPDLYETYYAENVEDFVGHPNHDGYDILADVFLNVLIGFDDVPPVLGLVEPADGSEDLAPLTQVRFQLYDFGSGIDLGATVIRVNGNVVEYTATGEDHAVEILYSPRSALPELVSVQLASRDLAFPANSVDRTVTEFSVNGDDTGPCQPDAVTLCIDDQPGDRRFKVTMEWETELGGGQEGEGFATPLAVVGLEAGGLLSFFDGNPEVLIKVLNSCNDNDRFWVFGAATTTLGFDLLVEDTLARRRGALPSDYQYRVSNVDGEPAAPFFDIEAFATCDYEG